MAPLSTLSLVCLTIALWCPVLAISPDHGKQMYGHRSPMDMDSKALFTLGALAVLGGASYYIGKQDGFKHHKMPMGGGFMGHPLGGHLGGAMGPPVGGYLGGAMGGYSGGGHGMYGGYPVRPPMVVPRPYPMMGYPSMQGVGGYMNGGSHHGMLVSSYRPPLHTKKGFSAGFYASKPMYGLPWRKRRQTKDGVILRTVGEEVEVPDNEFKYTYVFDPQSVARSSTKDKKGDERSTTRDKSSFKVLFEDDVESRANKNQKTSPKIVFKDDEEVTRGKRSTKDIAVASAKVEQQLEDDLYTRAFGSRSPEDYKPVSGSGFRQGRMNEQKPNSDLENRFNDDRLGDMNPSFDSESRYPKFESNSENQNIDSESGLREGRMGGMNLNSGNRFRDGRIVGFSGSQNRQNDYNRMNLDTSQRGSNCEPVQGRQFDQFTEMMLSTAITEDSDMCGQSLLCVVGRMPITMLPPKALGLRSLIKESQMTMGRSQPLWQSLSEALETGERSGSSCERVYTQCPIPHAQLMEVFSRL